MLPAAAAGSAEHDDCDWDGRDDLGRLVPPGKYRYTFNARYLPDRAPVRHFPFTYDEVFVAGSADEAYASSDEIIVDFALTPAAAEKLHNDK